MADLSKFSNEELLRIYGGDQMQPAKVGDLGNYTDEELMKIYNSGVGADRPATAMGRPIVPASGDLSTWEDMARATPTALYHAGTGLATLPGTADALMSGVTNTAAVALGLPEGPRLFGKEGLGRYVGGSILPTQPELEGAIGLNPYEPQTGPGKIWEKGLELGAGSALLGGESVLQNAIKGGVAGAAGEALGQGAEAIGEPQGVADAARLAGTAIAGGGAALMRPRDLSPTRAALAEEAGRRFTAADNAGVAIAQHSVADMVDGAIDLAVREGQRDLPEASRMLTPTPMTEAALAMFNDASVHDLTLTEAHRLRQALGNAISRADGNDRRIVMGIRNHLDDWIEGLTQHDLNANPAFLTQTGRLPDPQQASQDLMTGIGLWSRVRKSDTLAEMADDASIRANPAQGYTYGEALRQEYKKLALSDRLRTFTPEEQTAIRRVANGGPIDQTLQLMAEFYPFSMAGALRGGVVGGGLAYGGRGALGAAFPIAGLFGRAAANALTRKNAAIADMLVRGGAGSVPTGPILSGVPLALYGGNMATQGP